jgi:CheY-like chemotaxis protein
LGAPFFQSLTGLTQIPHPLTVAKTVAGGFPRFLRLLDAIEKANTSKPDLILLDLAMPRLTGAEAATVLRNDMPETPVVLFTMTDLNAGSLCESIGVEFISKTDVSKLLERVDALFPPHKASATTA